MVQFREERSHRRRFDVDRKTVFEAPIPLSSRQKENEGESYDIVVGERKGDDKATQRNFWTCDEPTVVSSKVIRDPACGTKTDTNGFPVLSQQFVRPFPRSRVSSDKDTRLQPGNGEFCRKHVWPKRKRSEQTRKKLLRLRSSSLSPKKPTIEKEEEKADVCTGLVTVSGRGSFFFRRAEKKKGSLFFSVSEVRKHQQKRNPSSTGPPPSFIPCSDWRKRGAH